MAAKHTPLSYNPATKRPYGIKHPGALTLKAKAAGQSIDAFAKAHEHSPGQTGKQARFYLYMLRRKR